MIAVGINGYGTIGKRVADAIRIQPDMRVAGVVKATPDQGVALAADRGFPLYAADPDRYKRFREHGDDPVGTLEDLLAKCDIIVDATPGGIGKKNTRSYDDYEVPYILQGAESATAADESFCARANGRTVLGSDSLRVVSCNTTGIARSLAPLTELQSIEHVDATIVRRGGDPSQPDRGPINDVIPTAAGSSHHADDVRTILPELPIQTVALTVPTTLMHVHRVTLTFEDSVPETAIRRQWAAENRIALVPTDRGLDAISALIEVGRDMGRPRGDIWETCLWDASIDHTENRLSFIQAVHQESIVVPETIDAIRTLISEDPLKSATLTDEQLGVGDLRFEVSETTSAIPAE